MRDLSEALRLGGKFTDNAQYLRGKALVKTRQPTEAIEDLTMCLRSCKELSVAGKINIYDNLGTAHLHLGQFDQAVLNYTEIIDRLFPLYCPAPCRTPYSADTYYQYRGLAYLMSNKLPPATRDFTEAIKRARTAPSSGGVQKFSLFARVLTYARAGKKQEAVADLNAINELCHSNERDHKSPLDDICKLRRPKFPDFVAALGDEKWWEEFVADYLRRSPREKDLLYEVIEWIPFSYTLTRR